MVGGAVDFSVADSSQVQALIDLAAAGDAGAAASLVDGIAPVVRARVARALSRRQSQSRGRILRQDREDLVQETFAGLFDDGARLLRSWDPARGLGFLGFVGLLAEREVGMRMRARKRNPWTEDPTAKDALAHLGGASEGLALQIESRDLLRRIVARLGERLTAQGSRYFELLFLEARSVQAVAKETGASADALYAWRSRLSRLVRAVHAELADCAD
jgi:DNA-directed RNA polymerase specialized sigma24 family protein